MTENYHLNNKNKDQFVHNMFDNLAQDYDKMNNIISLGSHKIIKKIAVDRIKIQKNSKILDICTGTGDIAIYLAKKYPESKVIGIDFSEKMLEIASEKARDINNIEFLLADALNMPFNDEEFYACFVSFGLRNLKDLKKGLLEIRRVTRCGGYVSSVDLGKVKGITSYAIRPYLYKVVPLFGKIFHGKISPYKYLPESNESFPSPVELVKMLEEIGFNDVKNYNYLFGTIAQQVAVKKY